jgi:hypothetical protein
MDNVQKHNISTMYHCHILLDLIMWAFGFHKRRGISLVAEQILASQEWFRSLGLNSYLVYYSS